MCQRLWIACRRDSQPLPQTNARDVVPFIWQALPVGLISPIHQGHSKPEHPEHGNFLIIDDCKHRIFALCLGTRLDRRVVAEFVGSSDLLESAYAALNPRSQ